MISKKVLKNLSRSSWIRAMFEEGEKLRKIHGAKNVFDFSIGNPDVEPPFEVKEALKNIIMDDKTGMHGYMNNAGYPLVREKVAKHLSRENGMPILSGNVVMSVGASGALNVVFKTLLNPEDEVIVFAPYFVEYGFIVDNHGGKLVIVETDCDSFLPDPQILAEYINSKTKAIIINSPNNPTGVIYDENTLAKLAEVIKTKEKQYNTSIFIVSDEPYSKIVYDDVKVPSILKIFKNVIKVDSYSKSLSLPGERIGYIVVSPEIEDAAMIVNGLIFCTRTLGFVNAPALFQRVIAEALDAKVNTDEYKVRRDFLHEKLTNIGYTCVKPQGAFYLFPKSLIPDDIEFVRHAIKYNLLLVPGSGFGAPGYFRISYCVAFQTIKDSIPAFEKLYNDFR
jgi:aspartate aminotransferase